MGRLDPLKGELILELFNDPFLINSACIYVMFVFKKLLYGQDIQSHLSCKLVLISWNYFFNLLLMLLGALP